MDQYLLEFKGTPASILAEAENLVRLSRHQRDDLVRNVKPEEATFANVVTPLAHMENHFTSVANILTFYRHVAADKDTRAASAQAQTLFDDFHSECWLREDVFNLVEVVYNNSKESSEESSLYVERWYNRYVHNGLKIRDDASRKRFKEIQGRLSEISGRFRENLAHMSTAGLWFTEAELAGVPEGIITKLQKNTEESMLKIEMSDPDFMELLVYAENGETRKKIFMANENRCNDNTPLLKEALGLRFEMARLLGFSSYASMQLQRQHRMARTPGLVNEFLSSLRSQLTPPALEMLRLLQDLKKSDNATCDGKGAEQTLFLWDQSFYRNKFLESHIPNKARTRGYFPLQTTTAAIMQLFAGLFSLTFEKVDATGGLVWHSDVQVFAVHENHKGGGGFLGYLYLDLFHRDGKYPQASCFSLQPGYTREDGTRQHPSTAFLCAFPKPTSKKPTLLSHWDVVQMVHELGHGIHDLVSKTTYAHFHGPEGVPVDFGELPSQMLEYWCWVPSLIKPLTCHYSYLSPELLSLWKQENENQPQPPRQMPDEVIEALVKSSRIIFGPLFQLDQVHRARFDMMIHGFSNEQDIAALDLNVEWNKSRTEVGLIGGLEALSGDCDQGCSYTTFSHLMIRDYTAGYYAYLYSKVYAADVFYSKFHGKELDVETGGRWRRVVLEPGGSQDGMKILTEFLGREPRVDAFRDSLVTKELSL